MNVSNIIIILFISVILFFAVRGTIQHMKGEGSCCGGPKEKAPKKKISGKPLSKLKVTIEGMHCDNCKNRVERKLDELDGVVAKVKLSQKAAYVSLYKEIPESLICDTITKAGYEVISVEAL